MLEAQSPRRCYGEVRKPLEGETQQEVFRLHRDRVWGTKGLKSLPLQVPLHSHRGCHLTQPGRSTSLTDAPEKCALSIMEQTDQAHSCRAEQSIALYQLIFSDISYRHEKLTNIKPCRIVVNTRVQHKHRAKEPDFSLQKGKAHD